MSLLPRRCEANGVTVGLLVAPDFKPNIGGVAEHAHQLMKHLTELGERVVVMAPEAYGSAQFDRTCSYQVVRFPLGKGRLTSRLYRVLLWRWIFRTARAVKPNYLALSLWDPITGCVLAVASKLLRVPLLLFAHGQEVALRSRWSSLRRATFRSASRVVCVSAFTKSILEELGLDGTSLEIVPNGFDCRIVEKYRQERDAESTRRVDKLFIGDRPTLLTISRLQERKGIDRVIAAMPSILSSIPNAAYVVGGDGPDRARLEGLRCASPAREAIAFLGRITDEEKWACYDRCNVFAMPNRIEGIDVEGFGIVFLEANAFGKPIVGGRSGGAVEAIVDGETGLLVDPHDIAAIAASVVRLLKNADEAMRLGENGRRRVETVLSWFTCAHRFRSIVLEACGIDPTQQTGPDRISE